MSRPPPLPPYPFPSRPSPPSTTPSPSPSPSPSSPTATKPLAFSSASSSVGPGGFQYPEYYDFPPFFTIQPNLTTRAKQLKLWTDLLISYVSSLASPAFSHTQIGSTLPSASTSNCAPTARTLTILVSQDTPTAIFTNKKINRSLSLQGVRLVCDELINRGYAVYLASTSVSSISSSPTSSAPTSSLICLSSHRIDEWSILIDTWATEHGVTISTIYEIQTSDASRKQAFYGLAADIIYAALLQLQRQGKCSLIAGESLTEMGVKFSSGHR